MQSISCIYEPVFPAAGNFHIDHQKWGEKCNLCDFDCVMIVGLSAADFLNFFSCTVVSNAAFLWIVPSY